MTPSDLVEIEQIRQLKARYFLLMDQKRWEEWAQVFCEDVTIDTTQDASPLLHGRQAFLDFLPPILEGVLTAHHGHSPIIELLGPRQARGTWAWRTTSGFRRARIDAIFGARAGISSNTAGIPTASGASSS